MIIHYHTGDLPSSKRDLKNFDIKDPVDVENLILSKKNKISNWLYP